MIVKVKESSEEREIFRIRKQLEAAEVDFREVKLFNLHIFYSDKDFPFPLQEELKEIPEVEVFSGIKTPYQLVSKKFHPENHIIDVDGVKFGGPDIQIIAGPCAIESEEQVFKIAEKISKAGIPVIRGGAYKPRTSPYAFQGLEEEGLKIIRRAADEYNLKVVTEVLDYNLLDKVYPYADILQVGSRNMHNYYFLKQLGKVNKPVLLKRGMYSKISEWLLSAEYILSGGNEKVILCERGIRSFDEEVRNLMDISAIPIIKNLSFLPVIADPSQGTGRRDLIHPMSAASIAAGADGLMIEIHPKPSEALSDGPQSLYLDDIFPIIKNLLAVAKSIGRNVFLQPIKMNEYHNY